VYGGRIFTRGVDPSAFSSFFSLQAAHAFPPPQDGNVSVDEITNFYKG
jgi:hypothetical protein